MIFIYDDMQVRVDPKDICLCRPLRKSGEFHMQIHRDIDPDIADALIMHGAPKQIVYDTANTLWFPVVDEPLFVEEHWNLYVLKSGDIIIDYEEDNVSQS